jgi:hypothetical protein
MTEYGLACGEPSVEQFFEGLFASRADVAPERARQLVVYLASGQADALSGRYTRVNADVREMIGRAQEIEERDLYVMRKQE